MAIKRANIIDFLFLLASILVVVSAYSSPDQRLYKRDDDDDDDGPSRGPSNSYTFIRHARNAHACIMSIVFIILLPLGAIAIHLPISKIPGLRNSYLVKKVPAIHMPIQLLALVMMIGALGLGIRIALDMGYFGSRGVRAHLVIGLIVTTSIILFQPALGILQHRFYKRTGRKSMFGYAHRWIGRVMIILGIINNGLGFQLASEDIIVPNSSYIRNFVLAGIFLLIWAGLVAYDTFFNKEEVTPVETERKKGSPSPVRETESVRV